MKITITGSLGNIGAHLVENLVTAGHEVTVISSNNDRKNDIGTAGAKAAIGSITDTEFVTSAFSGADAVFAMTPPNFGGQNVIENTINAGKSIATAIKNAGVKRVVMLSSLGAQHKSGTGPIVALHNIEKIYSELSDVSITFLRAGYFYTNFFNDVPMIKNAGIMGSNFASDTKLPIVHPADIAEAAAKELQILPTGQHNIHYIVSDYLNGAEIAKTFGEVIGKPELSWIEFTDEQSLEGMAGAGLPEELANIYTEMGTSIRNGKFQGDFDVHNSPTEGKTKLKEFAEEFAKLF